MVRSTYLGSGESEVGIMSSAKQGRFRVCLLLAISQPANCDERRIVSSSKQRHV